MCGITAEEAQDMSPEDFYYAFCTIKNPNTGEFEKPIKMAKETKITTEKILGVMEEMWKTTPRTITAHTGKLGYKNFLDAMNGGDVDINTIREGMYSIGTSTRFVGFAYPNMPDGYRAVDVTNDDGTHSYFIDAVFNEWCIETTNISKEEFLKLKEKT